MIKEIKVPALGESVSEATVSKWFKSVGDAVVVDEVVCDLETEKVSMEVPSPVEGIITAIEISEGTDVAVGTVLCVITEGKVEQKPVAKKADTTVANTSVNAPAKAPVDSSPAVAPSAKRVAEEKGIDLQQAVPTGGRGNITKQDVETLSPGVKPEMPSFNVATPVNVAQKMDIANRPQDARGEEYVPMSRLRQVIAGRLKESQNTAAMLTTFNEVDMTRLMALRAKYKVKFEKKHGTRLGFMSFFVKAAVQALQELPAVNAEIYGDTIIYKDYKDIGIAVGTEKGLVVPVLRDAEDMSVMNIESTIADFGNRAKNGNLTIEEMTGGSFTITNGGVFGSLLSTPIINPPQSAILGLHKIEKRAVVIDDEIVIRQMMYLALTYDHRIIDGREAVTFLVRIKEFIEDPERLLLDI